HGGGKPSPAENTVLTGWVGPGADPVDRRGGTVRCRSVGHGYAARIRLEQNRTVRRRPVPGPGTHRGPPAGCDGDARNHWSWPWPPWTWCWRRSSLLVWKGPPARPIARPRRV